MTVKQLIFVHIVYLHISAYFPVFFQICVAQLKYTLTDMVPDDAT